MADFEVTEADGRVLLEADAAGVESMFRVGSAAAERLLRHPGAVTVTFQNGAPRATIEMTEASRQNIPDSLFAVPAGYKKREMPTGRGRQNQ